MAKQPWDNFFVPEDFETFSGSGATTLEIMAMLANAKLARAAEGWPVINGWENPSVWDIDNRCGVAHTARLAFIAPIVKQECRHEPGACQNFPAHGFFLPVCRHCGVRLAMPSEWRAE